jgi:phospholipase C
LQRATQFSRPTPLPGDLPDFSYIEPTLVLGHGDYHPAVSRVLGHGDYHPAVSRVLGHGIVLPGVDPPSSILGGEAFLTRIYNAYQAMRSPAGANVWNGSSGLQEEWTARSALPGPRTGPKPQPAAATAARGWTATPILYRRCDGALPCPDLLPPNPP